jgi:hypothetical protein
MQDEICSVQLHAIERQHINHDAVGINHMAAHAVPRARDGNFQMIRACELQKSGQLFFRRFFVRRNFPDFCDARFVEAARVVDFSRRSRNDLVSIIPGCFDEIKNRVSD